MPYLLPALLLAFVLVGAAWWLSRAIRQALERARNDTALTLLQNQVHAVAQQTAQQAEALQAALRGFSGQIGQALDATRKGMDERLDGAARVIQGVSVKLGQLDEASKRIFDVGRDIAGLQEILRAPKLRGNIGELFLDDLLGQILPPEHYRMQHAFRNGQAVDAVIVLRSGMVPVDAKFPLDNFRQLVAAAGDEARAAARKLFARDVKKHIDAIAEKYIRTDEGTFDFALMYIPAENVYYETIIKDDSAEGESALFQYALKKRVIPVSPNSFYAYLQTILLGLKGLRIEESARELLDKLVGLRRDLERFDEAFRLIGQHLDNSKKKYDEAEKRLTKIEGHMEQLEGTSKGLEAPASPPSVPLQP
ncbi:MAG: DNA recombination protein RmuC [Kiritimatiellae bacterium]|nr:DNA recombination protein RmuC [Kiritimatiellia bacterium]